MLRVAFVLLCLVALMSLAVPAQAGPVEDGDAPMATRGEDRTARTHDSTYVRLSMGPGYLHTSFSEQGSSLTIHGTGMGLGVAVGGTVAPNLIVFGEFAFLTVSNPTVTVDGTSGSNGNSSFDHIGFGPGVTYYFMPLNLYLSGSVLFGRVQAQDNNSNRVVGQTNLGPAFRLSIGKEWWVSSQWGLGAAVQGLIAWNHDSGVDSSFTTTGLALAFSATYN